MELRLLIIPLLAFVITYFVIRFWIKFAKREKIVVKDVNKFNKPKVPTLGGIAVLCGFLASIFFYIALSIFYFKRTINLIEILALLTTLLIISFIGLLDYLGGWKRGFKQWQKPLLTLPAAMPLMAINAGYTHMLIPFIGRINTGYFYPLVLIPIAVMGASQGFNMLAGLNGLSVGLATIILFALGFISWQTQQTWLAIICIAAVASLLAFLIFNKYPAKILPGDVLRYPLGALIAGVAILGNLERAALILFIPFFIELFIKTKHKMKTECFLVPQEDNSLEVSEIGSLTHLIGKLLKKFKSKIYESNIVLSLYIFELILAIIVIMI